MGAVARWGECVGMVGPDVEYLDNGFDDDCDGDIDEPDGQCLASETPRETTCSDGQDNDCDGEVDCDDGDCSTNANCSDRCANGVPENSVPGQCSDGFDNDCDLAFDCNDTDCSDTEECQTMMERCPTGQTGVYTEQDPGRGGGSSSISAGNGQAIWEQTECGTSPCYASQVYVQPRNGAAVCVPPPEECPEGQSPNYLGSGQWECGGDCDYLVEYGHIYNWKIVCAPRPELDCRNGQTPTFVFETESWRCLPTCNNTLYDRVRYEGQLLCIPC